MGRRARWGLWTAALVLAASSSAWADDDRANREAEARFKEGLARVKNKDYEAARLSFQQAYAVLHRPLILWNLALSEEKTAHPLDALEHFRQVARDAPVDADRASAQKHVEALLAQLSRIDVQAVPGTAIAVDGGDAVTTPLADPIDVTAGHHSLVAKWPSGASKSSEVDAVAGQVAHVTFMADAPPAPVAAAAPVPMVMASAAPPPGDVPPPGTPSAPASDQGPQPFWTARTTTSAVLLGVGVVAVGFAAGFGIASGDNKSKSSGFYAKYGPSGCTPDPTSADCVSWTNAVNAQNRDANLSDALYFTAAAFAVGAGVSWFFWPKAHPRAAWLLPQVGPGRAGVEAGGSF